MLLQSESKPPSGRSRRIWRRIGLAALVLGLTSAALLSAFLYTADAEFVAGALSRLLGRHVEIGAIAFRPGASLEVEIEKLRILETAGSDGPPMLEVEHAVGRQAWPRLLAGQLLPLDWVVHQPVLRLHAAAGTEVAVDFASLPRLGLSVHDGEVSYQPKSGDPWIVRGLTLEAKRAGFGTRVEGEASARLARGASALSELALRFSADRKHVEARGTVAGLELGALPQTSVSARGAASGSFDLAYAYASGDVTGKLDLEFAKLSVRAPALDRPVAPTRAKLGLDIDWSGSVLALGLRPLALDDLVANGSFTLDTSSPGRLALDVTLAPFEPAHRERLNPLGLLGMKIDTWKTVAAQIDAGTVENIHLRIDVPRATAAAQLSFDAPLDPQAFELELTARDGTYRPNPRTVLAGMAGRLEIHGDVLAVQGLHMTEDGDPVPELNVRIDGLARLVTLPDDEDEVSGGPGAELHGLAAAVEGLADDDDQSSEEAPSVLFTDLALRYPAFVLPLREASGRLRFPGGGVATEGVRGVLGGAPAELDVKWDPAADRIDVDVRYLEGLAPGQPITGPRWLSASVALDELEVGDLRLSEVRSRLDAEGVNVHFSEMTADLAGGAVTGSGDMSIGEAGRAPFRFDLEARGFNAAPLVGAFGLPEGSITGTGHAKGHVAGALRAAGHFATDGELAIGVALKDGTIADLPVLVALARLPSLSGVSMLLGRPLPYDSLIADFKLANGKLEISDAKLLGPQLRMLGSGETDLNTPTKESDVVVALLFLQTLDSVIGSLPIVRNVVLGKDRNLLALYFRLRGPRDDLRVTPLAPERLRDIVGFASDAVMHGIRSLGSLIPGTGGSSNEAGEETPAPSAPPP